MIMDVWYWRIMDMKQQHSQKNISAARWTKKVINEFKILNIDSSGEQIPDYIIHDGKVLSSNVVHLETYFANIGGKK